MSESKEEWPAIGIDLGTKYSCVGVWQNGRIEIIANDQNNRTTPSFVAFTDTMRVVGEAAVDQGRLNSTNTIFDAKRMIGRRFDDKMVQKDMGRWPFKVISGCENEKPMVVISYDGNDKYFFAEEISAMILMKMKDIAESYLDLPVKNAVVTVPANFNDSQRQATKDAGAIAGLNVIRIINEPTAAAIAYGFDNNKSYTDFSEKNLLVFDLGGGTFDVSLVSIENDIFTVMAVGGNTHLGGSDFDNNMVNYFADLIKRKHSKDVSQCPTALGRLRAACERAKSALSTSSVTTIEIDSLFNGIDFTSSISRARFDILNKYLFVECIQIVKTCLKDAGIDKSEVDDILLVGGSTRIPKIQQLLQEFFDGKELSRSINPDEAVAYGAAVHAAALCGVTNDHDMVIFDVTPLSLSVKATSGTMSVVIPKNTTTPTREVRTYATSPVTIPLYEGERHKAKDNNLLGFIELPPVSRSIRSQKWINVCFEIDLNGILNCSARDRGTGKKSEIKIINRSRLTSVDVDILVEDAHEYKAQECKAKNKLRNYANEQRERIFHCGQKLTYNDKKPIWEAVEQILGWLEQNSNHVVKAAEYEVKLKALQQICRPLMNIQGEVPAPSHWADKENSATPVQSPHAFSHEEENSTTRVWTIQSPHTFSHKDESSSTWPEWTTQRPYVFSQEEENLTTREWTVQSPRAFSHEEENSTTQEWTVQSPHTFSHEEESSLTRPEWMTQRPYVVSQEEENLTTREWTVLNPRAFSHEEENSSTREWTVQSPHTFSQDEENSTTRESTVQSPHKFPREEDYSTTYYQWTNDTKTYKPEDERRNRNLTSINALENYAYKMLEILNENKRRLRTGDRIKIKDEIKSVVEWLNRNNDLKDASIYEKKLKLLQDFCDPIIAGSSKSIKRGKNVVGNIVRRPFHGRNLKEEIITLGKDDIHEKVANDLEMMRSEVEDARQKAQKEVEAMRKEYTVKMANMDKLVEEKVAQLLKAQGLASSSNKVKSDEDNLSDSVFKQYDFATLQIATRYFSVKNKLGQGGFGTVYKGTLLNGEIVAIKRLSAASGQGTKEFMTEARLLAKLQHRNLVKIMGSCSEGEEKLLVYEFMPNSSLDSFLFDPRKRQHLDWEVRRKIIIGIARGLQYLHEDSRLTIIHRDLKPANILLDAEMNTKIADFGVAKLFESAQKLANTANIVGTLGYMAPEYMLSGEYSDKTDVYSFGIMLLEIVTGQRNRVPQKEDLSIKTWRLWNEGLSFKIADPMLVNNCSRNDVMRLIQIGLLCVQINPEERPTMTDVVLMLVAGVNLQLPSPPAMSFNNRSSVPIRAANKLTRGF